MILLILIIKEEFSNFFSIFFSFSIDCDFTIFERELDCINFPFLKIFEIFSKYFKSKLFSLFISLSLSISLQIFFSL